MTQIEADTFIRSNQSGWGTASNGDTWSTGIGTPTLSIASNEGHATNISAQALMNLGSTTSADAEGLVRVKCSATTSTRMGVALRRTASNTCYIGRLSAAANNLLIGKIVSGTETDLTNVTFTVSTGTFYWIRYRIVGSTHFLKAWADGSAEPAAWNINAFSDSSITGAGGVGLTINATNTACTWDFDSFYAYTYLLEDATAAPTDSRSDALAYNPVDTSTLTDASTVTGVNLATDALSAPTDSQAYVLNQTETYLFSQAAETQMYALTENLVDITLNTGDFISSVGTSTVSNIAGTDTSSISDSASYFLDQFNIGDAITTSDTFSFSYTFNNPYAGTRTLEKDTFVRANQSGWGTASNGDTWAVTLGSSTLSIASNEGHATGTTSQANVQLGSTTNADAEVLVRCQTSDTNSNRMGVSLRQTASNTFYAAKMNVNSGVFSIGKVVTGTITDLFTTSSFVASAATYYWIRFKAVGTFLAAKIWADGTAEPAAWTVSGTDSSITGAGGVGLTFYSSNSATTWDFNAFNAVDYSMGYADGLTFTDSSTVTVVGLRTDQLTVSPTLALALTFTPADTPTLADVLNGGLAQSNGNYNIFTQDTFHRANQSNWGTASDGSTWSVTHGSLTYAISSNTGTATGTTGDGYSILDADGYTVEDIFANFQMPNSNNTKFGIIARYIDSNNFYYAYVDFTSQNGHIARFVGGTYANVTSFSISITAATNYIMRFNLNGSNLSVKIWQDGTAEPAWTSQGTDTNFANVGKVGLFTSVTAGTLTVNSFFGSNYFPYDQITNVDASTTTDVFVPTDALTETEQVAYALAESVTDLLSVLDLSSLFLYVPIDQLTQVESVLFTEIYAATDTATLSDTIVPTLIRIILDVALSLLDVSTFTYNPLLGDIGDTLDTTGELYQEIEVFHPVETLTELESVLYVLALTYPTDSNTILDSFVPTINPALLDTVLSELESISWTFVYSRTDTLAVVDTFFDVLTQLQTDSFAFINDLSAVFLTQFDTGSLTETEIVSYGISVIDTLSQVLVDATTLTLVQFETESQSFATSDYAIRIQAVPVDSLTELESVTYALAFAWQEASSLVELLNITLQIPQTDTLVLASELVAEVLKFFITETFIETELYTLTLALPFAAETVTLAENYAVLLNQTETYQLSITELITDALALTFAVDTQALAESFLTTLIVPENESQTLVETTLIQVIQKLTDALTSTDTQAYALTSNLSDLVLSADSFSSALAISITDVTLSVLDTLTLALATRFPGWVDAITILEQTLFAQQYVPTDSQTFADSVVATLQFIPSDLATLQDIVVATLLYAASDSATLLDLVSPTLQQTSIDSNTQTEQLNITALYKPIDTLAAQELFAMVFALSLLDTVALTDILLPTLTNKFVDIALASAESVLYGVVYVPVEQLLALEVMSVVIALALLDIGLTPIELLTGLGYALFDVALTTSDLISYTQNIFKLAYVHVRSGGIAMKTRIGETIQP